MSWESILQESKDRGWAVNIERANANDCPRERDATWSTMYLSDTQTRTNRGLYTLRRCNDTDTQFDEESTPQISSSTSGSSSKFSTSDTHSTRQSSTKIEDDDLCVLHSGQSVTGSPSLAHTNSSENPRPVKPMPRRAGTVNDENAGARPVAPAFGVSLNFAPHTGISPSGKSDTGATEVATPSVYQDTVKQDYGPRIPLFSLSNIRSSSSVDKIPRSSFGGFGSLRKEDVSLEMSEETESDEGENEDNDDHDDEEIVFDWDTMREIEDEDELEEEEEFHYDPVTPSEDDQVNDGPAEDAEKDENQGQAELDAYDELLEEELVFPVPVKSMSEARVHARRHARNNAVKARPESDDKESGCLAVWCRWHGCNFPEEHELDEFVTHYSVHLLMAARDACARS
ncbi:hypothetical protein EV361DRAFT_947184 [Lentinula raphanica]|uniref:Uncharacterized protein n=1 Tax=Lentinula raphanica TaxID=153919 RepID=A0AA38P6V0_9AGAR|nr:hypothetical protein F5878DRAFT_662163 [Lentinula raphanica]KAJ3974239.1 hypothetical protein EV361DRAFT_947184 [Lentinula raphanica]